MKVMRKAIAVGVVISIIVFSVVTVWNFYGYVRAMTVSDAAADRFYSYDILESAQIKETLKSEKSSLQGMATRKRSAMFGDMFKFGSVVLVLSLSFGAVYAFERLDSSSQPRYRRRNKEVFGPAEASDDEQYESRMQ